MLLGEPIGPIGASLNSHFVEHLGGVVGAVQNGLLTHRSSPASVTRLTLSLR